MARLIGFGRIIISTVTFCFHFLPFTGPFYTCLSFAAKPCGFFVRSSISSYYLLCVLPGPFSGVTSHMVTACGVAMLEKLTNAVFMQLCFSLLTCKQAAYRQK